MNHYLEIVNSINRGAPYLTNNWHIGNFYLPISWETVIVLGFVTFIILSPIVRSIHFCEKFGLEDFIELGISFLVMLIGCVVAIVIFAVAGGSGDLAHKELNEFNQALTQVHHEYPYYAKVNGKKVYCTAKPELGKKVTFVTIHNDAIFAPSTTKYVASHKQEVIAIQLENVRDSKKSLKDLKDRF